MKIFRNVTFGAVVASLAFLLGATANSFCLLVQLVGFRQTINLIFSDPRIFIDAYYGGLGYFGFNFDWFGWNGPLVLLTLLILLLITNVRRD